MAKQSHELVAVTVVLTQAEYRSLKPYKGMTPDGTMNNVIRSRLHLQPRAQGQLQSDAVVYTEADYLARGLKGA